MPPGEEGRWTYGQGQCCKHWAEKKTDHTAMEARGPKGPLTIDLTLLCQPGSACRFSKIYLLLLEGEMGIVVLMIVNLFSSSLHLNTDLSQREDTASYYLFLPH